MELIVTLIYTAIFAYLISKIKLFELDGVKKYWVISVFLLKILAAYGMVWIYSHTYPNRSEADIFKFFDDGKVLFGSIFTHPSHYFQMLTGIYIEPDSLKPYFGKMNWWYKPIYPEAYNETRIMIRLNAFLMLFSLGYYMVHAVFMCFLSLVGGLYAYKMALLLLNKRNDIVLLALILLLPSILFWSSGVLKEGVVLFLLSVVFYQLFVISQQSSIISRKSFALRLLSLSVCLLLLAFTKPFLLLCMFPAAIAFGFLHTMKIEGKKVIGIYAFVNLICLLVFFNLYRLGPAFDMVYQLCYKRGEYIYLAEQMHAGSLLYNNYLDFNWWAVVSEAPVALFYALFSPMPWQNHSLFSLACFAETAGLITIISYQLLLNKQQATDNRQQLSNNQQSTNYTLALFNFLLYAFILIGLTTPLAGSLVRYRAPLLCFLIIVVFSVVKLLRSKK